MSRKKIYRLTTIGVFGALVFVSNFISFSIPVAGGDVTRVHVANGVCLLAGLILGPMGGGLAAGIGSGLFDLTDPRFITSAPFTLLFKFLLAFIPGLLAKKGKLWRSILGCILGQLAYIALYLGKSLVQGLLEGSVYEALLPGLITKLGSATLNAVIAVAMAIALGAALKSALKKSGLRRS